jgi:crotonobetainyl-CoA:carnitine CoA-transferase CaiB-like acyl-CoA transferase
MLHPQAANALMSGKVPTATGNGHPNIAPYDMYPTQTKSIYLAVGTNGQFAKLCEILGVPELPRDPRFGDNAARLAHRAELTDILRKCLLDHAAEALEPTLLRAGVPAGMVRNVSEALEHPHTRHRGMVVSEGTYRGTGIPAKFSRTPGSVERAPPRFAEHNHDVLLEAGYSEKNIVEFISDGDLINPEL